jgi:polar amino acid transport system substrate-binding protein
MHIYPGNSHINSAYRSSYIFRKLAGLGLTLLLTRLLVLLLISMPVMAEDAVSPAQTDRVLKVGTMHSPPFIIENADGSFEGISIMLWDHIAKRLDLRYEFHTGNIETLLTQLETGEIDVAVAALTITEQREVGLDFTHPFYTTGLSLAVPAVERPNMIIALLSQLFSWRFLQVVGLLILVLLFVGWLVWFIEHNQTQLKDDSHTISKVSEGFWWAAATMTTVGYGDKTPLTPLGRALGVTWMFTALLLVASFIAAFSSILTVDRLTSPGINSQDLWKMQIATVPGSTSAAYLKQQKIAIIDYPSVEAGLLAVASGAADGMVYDAPLLKYWVDKNYRNGIDVLPELLERQDYGFALPSGSNLREPINRELLAKIRDPTWRGQVQRFIHD